MVEEVEYTIETSSITEPIVPEKTGYTGVWGAYTLDETNQTVEPVYTAIEYTITFNSNGAGDVASITKAGGESITLPTLSKYGYEFFGWFDASNAEFDSTTMPYQNKSLVAKWSDSYAGLEFVLINDSTEYKVTGIGSALDGGKTELLIPSVYNGIPVTSIGEAAFVPNFELETVKFEDNSNLTEIENWAFSSCFELKSVEFGANSKLDSIGDNAFADCSNLTEISIPDSVTSIGDSVFSCCESLTQIKVGADNQNYQSIDGNLYSKDGKTLIQYCAGKTATSFEIPSGVTMIGAGAFSTCTDLLDISIPDSVTMIGEDAFEDCTGLTGIVISDAVENIGDSAFAGCTGLLSIAIPDSVKTIGEDAFNGCESLTSVTFGASSQLTEIKDWTFAYCGDLTNIVIPDSISKIGERAFYKCNSLTINAEATEKPSGWHENWNSSNCPVIWGYRI